LPFPFGFSGVSSHVCGGKRAPASLNSTDSISRSDSC
jgi:hypothetical protein